jgi:hypothetical protein
MLKFLCGFPNTQQKTKKNSKLEDLKEIQAMEGAKKSILFWLFSPVPKHNRKASEIQVENLIYQSRHRYKSQAEITLFHRDINEPVGAKA